ncbi:MAG: DUF4872 domain-containing protein [Asgard group archaeon]|nr:DUF4872 domain-containing protein [Asgard group archaeon]
MNKLSDEFKEPDKEYFKSAGIGSDKIILDYNHIPGGLNCQTSALHKLYHYYGHDISEEMLVGIGSGLGFIYWYMKNMPAPFAGGMNSGKFPGLVGRIVERLNSSYKILQTSSVKTAHQHLKETLQMNQPAMICVDMAYVDYFGMGENQHFGQHMFLVYGIDEPNNLTYIADRFDVVCTLPLIKLQQARASKYPPFPAKNQMLQFTFPKNLPNLVPIIPITIKENVDYMLNPPIKNMGVSGILKWKNALSKYPEMIEDPLILVQALWNHFIYIETGGSGGAFFRKIYSRFLNEAYELTSNIKYEDASNDFNEIVDFWKKVAIALLPDTYPELRDIREILYKDNEELEEKGNEALKGILARQKRLQQMEQDASNYIKDEFQKLIKPVQELLFDIYKMEKKALENLSEK